MMRAAIIPDRVIACSGRNDAATYSSYATASSYVSNSARLKLFLGSAQIRKKLTK